LRQITLARDLALEAIELAQARSWHMVLYAGEGIYVQALRHPPDFYYDLLGTELYQVDDLAAVLTSDQGPEPSKFLLVAEKPQADCIQAELTAHFDGRLIVVRSHRLFVEGNPLGSTKGDALAWLADYLGVPQEQVMAIGDQGNDATMIAWAGLGVAMGGGGQAAQAAADWIAPPLSADGAAVAIERFLLNETGSGQASK
jgi:hydroxymethylpyrimidine pyrophosphatase-like HAD family hydrolase